jgi:hypothetical protein
VVTLGGPSGITAKVSFWLAELPSASVTWKVSDWLLALVAVPAIIPFVALRVNPAGNVPEVMVHLNGLVPPETLRVPP